ncbi:MAG: N-acetyl-gamma-glutamyl-phosphate reductase [Chloroflexi bacterium]|nr:N-acetyl-gamma-glutamyl-phosphate reductase [Chloroflexota bacterium]
MIKVGILNVTGYAGAELARLLYSHPEARLTSVGGRSAVGKPLAEVFPHLACYDLTVTERLDDVDFVFSALPHAASAEAVVPYVRQGMAVVDLSADFRLRDPQEYADWYGASHPAPDLLPDAVYGLSELNRDGVRQAKLVANPGCYPAGALLALAPAVKAGIVAPDIIVDSKSGVSGAGRSLGLSYHFAEANESVSAYGLEGHRHLPEIAQELACLWPPAEGPQPPAPRLTFTPHLVPMTRGILSTCYAPLVPGRLASGEGAKEQVRELYGEFYRGEPFVRVVDSPPATKQTLGNNLCLVYPTVDLRSERLVVVSAIDNLVKGAAGQAVQNMNLMLGFPETAGLDAPAVYP